MVFLPPPLSPYPPSSFIHTNEWEEKRSLVWNWGERGSWVLILLVL